MLRLLAKTTAPRSLRALSSLAEGTPSTMDVLIDLTLVDPSGARRKIKGVVGRTLDEICELHRIDLGPVSMGGPPEIQHTEDWCEPTFGEGPNAGYDHVILAGKGINEAAKKTPIEEQMLSDYWEFDEIYETSRLASCVKLTKGMNGMVVYIPDRLDDRIG